MSALTPTDGAIPEDILYIAQHVCGYIEAMPSEGNVNVIASAIMAERERCARIAEDADEQVSHWGNPRDSRIARGTCKAIADAIRNPHLPSGAAACAADSPARSTSSPISSGTDSSQIAPVNGGPVPTVSGGNTGDKIPPIVMTHQDIRA